METIALTPHDVARFWSKVKDDGDCWIWTAAIVRKYGMFRVKVDGKKKMKKAHRIAYELLEGPIPEGHGLDHTCHNEACVKPSHLRPVNAKQNAEHRLGANANSSSGIRGVHRDSRSGRWRVVIGHNGKHHRGGTYTDLNEAAEAARKLRASLFTHSDLDAA
jgi:hypothetical protein